MGKITLTMTTCKRLDFFKRTFASLQKNCSDLERISQAVCVDDNSSPEDAAEIQAMLEAEFGKDNTIFVPKTPAQKGLGYSLNFIWANVKTRYIFHLEDDWEFIQRGPCLQEAMTIIEDSENIKSVLIRDLTMFPLRRTKHGHFYRECLKGPDLLGEMRGHGYSLNPSVQDVAYLREKYQGFNLTDVENSFGEQYYADGLRTATLTKDYVRHIGDGISAFDLNWTPR